MMCGRAESHKDINTQICNKLGSQELPHLFTVYRKQKREQNTNYGQNRAIFNRNRRLLYVLHDLHKCGSMLSDAAQFKACKTREATTRSQDWKKQQQIAEAVKDRH